MVKLQSLCLICYIPLGFCFWCGCSRDHSFSSSLHKFLSNNFNSRSEQMFNVGVRRVNFKRVSNCWNNQIIIKEVWNETRWDHTHLSYLCYIVCTVDDWKLSEKHFLPKSKSSTHVDFRQAIHLIQLPTIGKKIVIIFAVLTVKQNEPISIAWPSIFMLLNICLATNLL